ncbi:sugar transferase [Streptomyces durbertensis]|uniref:Sugar transferase n=1 Tax=Streptomyces durbertensis TaxID=2448886 RepID=A0ABR6EF99_9ACTN|nr:sugar transferase [Streptomyces durbertensis]MBB1244023.1 sugar transferase [Streptomyces durbertensis]
MTAESAETHGSGRLLTPQADTARAGGAVFPPPRAADTGATRGPTAPSAGTAAGPLAADAVAVLAAGALAFTADLGVPLLAVGVGLAAVIALNAHGGLYRTGPVASALDELPGLAARAVLAWAAVAALLAAAAPERALGYPTLLLLPAAYTPLACTGRAVVYAVRRQQARRRPRSALVVGSGGLRGVVAATLLAHPEYGMRPVGLAVCGPESPTEGTVSESPRLPVLTSVEDVSRAVIQNAVAHAVFTTPPTHDPAAAVLARRFTDHGCAVWVVDGGPPGTARRPAGHLWGLPCRRLRPARPGRAAALAKRALDVAAASLGLLLTAPVLLACALAVRLADGPGILFRQERVGQGGRSFTLLKFRTLRPADALESATRWSVADDQRMSPVGRWLRRTSLDELPQLWNVLRGDMSLVGPRPERPYFVRQFSQRYTDYAERHRMPVGITGLAQVHGLRGDTSIEERARFDNLYIDTWSLWQDVRILLRTAVSLARPGGS